MEILGGKLIHNETNINARGGTEIIARALAEKLDQELLQHFQIIHSRVRQLDESKYRILVCHDLPGDPESDAALNSEGWKNFHRIVFVSHWQMQAYIQRYNIPWSKCIVLHNAIDPIKTNRVETADQTVRLIYTPTPHRGLDILTAVFDKIIADGDTNVHLDVFSSFKLYGWDDRDKEFQNVFDALEKNPHVTYHGSQPNDVVRDALSKSDIFAYPSTWPETSCLCLIEAMSAGLLCIHSDYGALPETAANWTYMYHFDEDKSRHAGQFHLMLTSAIKMIRSGQRAQPLQKEYVDAFYGWENRKKQWIAFLTSILDSGEDVGLPKATFTYRF